VTRICEEVEVMRRCEEVEVRKREGEKERRCEEVEVMRRCEEVEVRRCKIGDRRGGREEVRWRARRLRGEVVAMGEFRTFLYRILKRSLRVLR
jgi:hypothetical protein